MYDDNDTNDDDIDGVGDVNDGFDIGLGTKLNGLIIIFLLYEHNFDINDNLFIIITVENAIFCQFVELLLFFMNNIEYC